MARSFVQLSLDERRIIARLYENKISQAEIARRLRRDRSTICRELRRISGTTESFRQLRVTGSKDDELP